MFKKRQRTAVRTAYSGNAERVTAFTAEAGKRAAKMIYNKVKRLCPNVTHIYTDASSCYDAVYKEMNISEPHDDKSQNSFAGEFKQQHTRQSRKIKS